MNYTEVTIECKNTDETCDRLTALGVDGFVIENEDDFKAFLENNRQYWDYVDSSLEESYKGVSRVKFYVEDNEDGARLLDAVKAEFEVKTAPVCDADWENNWKQYYKPMEIGQRLLVIPQWEQDDPKVQKALAGGRVPLILEPGLTFGTGSHATTRLCLTALEKAVQGGEKVLDLGCGSGILSIAALKLGAASALAVDIDDKCLDVAYENAAMNGIGKDTYTVLAGDILSNDVLQCRIGGGYDVVLANIVADVIIGLAPMVRSLLSERGVFLCSGIIDERAEEVADKLRQAGLEILESRSAEGWFAYTCR